VTYVPNLKKIRKNYGRYYERTVLWTDTHRDIGYIQVIFIRPMPCIALHRQ